MNAIVTLVITVTFGFALLCWAAYYGLMFVGYRKSKR